MEKKEFQDLKSRSVFARLKRLFSNDVIVRNVGGKKLKIVDTDEVQYATDRASYRDSFNRVRTSPYNSYSRDFTLSYQASRIELFRDYDTMDMDPIISAALDIYADECLSKNELDQTLVIESPDSNIKGILNNLFFDVLNFDFNSWSWIRNLSKYGDFYLRLYISPEYGVYMIEPISAYNVTRIENSNPDNKNYIKFQVISQDGGKLEEIENYQIAHFRLLSDSNFLPYGKSMLEGARRVWKQLSLMEDAMLISRIIRAPSKRIFKVDVGNIAPNEVDAYMEKLISKTKKVPYMDERTGEYNLRYNIQNMLEDYYLPVRGSDSGTSIDTLEGMEFTGIDDIEYIKNKMMAALKIPKAFLGFDEAISGKATLASEDMRFSKTIQRIQNIFISELKKIAIVHLYSQGYRDDSLVNFKLSLVNPSTVFEKEKVSILSDKINLMNDMVENKMFSQEWIYRKVFKLTDEDIAVMRSQIVDDAKRTFRLTMIEEDGKDPAKPNIKMGGDADAGAGDGGDAAGPDSGGPDALDTALAGDKGEPGAADKKSEPPAELKERESQAGNKKASDYPLGEDPTGRLEYRNIKLESSLSLNGLLSDLDRQKQLLKEVKTKKSLLDVTNIIE